MTEPHYNRDAHMAFLKENLETILSKGTEAYQEFGRGIWVFTDNEMMGEHDPGTPGSTGIYITDLDKMPQDDLSKRLQGMVADYDPATQAVVLMNDAEGDHAYTIGARTKDTVVGLGRGKSHER